MKKPVLGLLLLSLLGAEARAQLNETFNSGIPTTWKRYNVDGLTPYSGQGGVGFVNDAWVAISRATNDSCIVSTSWYTPAGTANDWIVSPAFAVTSANTVLKYDVAAFDPTFADGYELRVFTGTNQLPTDPSTVLYSTTGAAYGWNTVGFNLGAYNGQTIRVAFRNNSNDKLLLGLDNIMTTVPANVLDVSVDSVIFPNLVGTTSTPLGFTFSNAGAQNITSMQVSYAVDGGTPVTQTFTGLNLAPFGKGTQSFTTGISGLAAGSHTVVVTGIQVNGTADPNAANNVRSKAFTAATASVQRAGLIEEFSSSTCVPCAAFNSTFDPLITSNNANVPSANFNVIKYQMNWPSPGNDASYNPHGVTRRSYYGVNSIPDHFTNGAVGGAGNQAEISASNTAPAFVTISGTYTVTNDSLLATVTVTPNFTAAAGSNYRLHVAAVERQYTNNAATTTQKNYVNVMRMMFPDGNGTALTNLTAGTAQTFTFKSKYTVGGVAQGNFNFWADPAGTDLVSFIQDNNSKDILQSNSVPANRVGAPNNPSSVSNAAHGVSVRIAPNPASDLVRLSFQAKTAGSMTVQIADATGRVVYQAEKAATGGQDEMLISTSAFAAGIYNVILRSENGTTVERLSIVK